MREYGVSDLLCETNVFALHVFFLQRSAIALVKFSLRVFTQ